MQPGHLNTKSWLQHDGVQGQKVTLTTPVNPFGKLLTVTPHGKVVPADIAQAKNVSSSSPVAFTLTARAIFCVVEHTLKVVVKVLPVKRLLKVPVPGFGVAVEICSLA
jgi:hypothetical protein